MAKIKTEKVEVELTLQEIDLLQQLVDSGLFGKTIGECVERLIAEELLLTINEPEE